jgi:hypothetical protein
MIFGEQKLLDTKSVLIFSTTLTWNISRSKSSATYYHERTQVFMQSTRYYCEIIMEFEPSRQIFEKYPNVKFNENPSSESRGVPCGRKDGRTDRQIDMTKVTVAFRNFANARTISGNVHCWTWLQLNSETH